MAVPVRTYGDSIIIIDGDSVLGQDAVSASGNNGGALPLTAGAGDGAGNGGDLTISAGAAGATVGANGGSITISAAAGAGATGTPGSLALETVRNSAADDASISLNTQAGSFSGSEWQHMTVGSEQSSGGATNTVLTVTGPTANGQNLKIRAWATAHMQTTTGNAVSQIIEQSFIRSSSTTFAMTANTNNRQTIGTPNVGIALSFAISGSNVNVQVTGDATEASNWMLEISWQIGGMAA